MVKHEVKKRYGFLAINYTMKSKTHTNFLNVRKCTVLQNRKLIQIELLNVYFICNIKAAQIN